MCEKISEQKYADPLPWEIPAMHMYAYNMHGIVGTVTQCHYLQTPPALYILIYNKLWYSYGKTIVTMLTLNA